jgi:kumamolisin
MPDEHFVAVPRSEREPLPDATPTGPSDPTSRATVTVVVRRRPDSNLGEILPEIARGAHPPLSRDDLAAQYGADPADLDRVAEFARAHGLAVDSTNQLHRTVVLSGTVADLAAAFDVDLAHYQSPQGQYRGRTGSVRIPADLAPIVEAVLGLDDRPQARPHVVVASPRSGHVVATEVVEALSPVQVGQLYTVPTGVTGQGQTIGLIELGGGYQESDLQSFFTGLGLPTPTVTAVSVDGATNSPSSPPQGADIEVALDVEVAGALAPGAAIAVYFAPNTDQGFLHAITTALDDSTHNPSVLSISWGSAESSWTGQAMTAFESAFQSAAALGVTVCCAAGDSGSSDGVGDGQAHVDFPASAPHALGCGGTRLDVNGTAILHEVVWNDGSGATGGGISDEFALPTWQQGIGVPTSVNPGRRVGRGVPDVSGNADPASGYTIVVGGSQTVGGTSAVAPLWAGLVALMNEALGRRAGYLNATIYGDAARPGFRDITSGSNGAYSAATGWDPCTGWGSPNGEALLGVLQGGGNVTQGG